MKTIPGHLLARALVELLQRPLQLGVDALLIEGPGDVSRVSEQPLEYVVVGPATREALDRLPCHRPELLVRLVPARDSDQLEALGKRALVSKVVQRRKQLAVGKIAGRAEDDQDRGVYGKPLQALDQRVLAGQDLLDDGAHCFSAAFTAWPPNWLRSAASSSAA